MRVCSCPFSSSLFVYLVYCSCSWFFFFSFSFLFLFCVVVVVYVLLHLIRNIKIILIILMVKLLFTDDLNAVTWGSQSTFLNIFERNEQGRVSVLTKLLVLYVGGHLVQSGLLEDQVRPALYLVQEAWGKTM